jgi:hypothetical protein
MTTIGDPPRENRKEKRDSDFALYRERNPHALIGVKAYDSDPLIATLDTRTRVYSSRRDIPAPATGDDPVHVGLRDDYYLRNDSYWSCAPARRHRAQSPQYLSKQTLSRRD